MNAPLKLLLITFMLTAERFLFR